MWLFALAGLSFTVIKYTRCHGSYLKSHDRLERLWQLKREAKSFVQYFWGSKESRVHGSQPRFQRPAELLGTDRLPLTQTTVNNPDLRESLMCNRILLLIATTIAMTLFSGDSSEAGETGWSARIIATGEFKEKIESTPIEMRPNRPLHFYGNTVRRRYYRAMKNSSQKTVSNSSKANSSDRG